MRDFANENSSPKGAPRGILSLEPSRSDLKTINLPELQQYLSSIQAHRNVIFILLTSEMYTKKGTVRKNWLHQFFEQNDEIKESVPGPETGAAVEGGIAIKVPDCGSFAAMEKSGSVASLDNKSSLFYMMSYKKEHVDMGDYIKALALYKGILYAEILGDKLMVSDNSEVDLKRCEIDAY